MSEKNKRCRVEEKDRHKLLIVNSLYGKVEENSFPYIVTCSSKQLDLIKQVCTEFFDPDNAPSDQLAMYEYITGGEIRPPYKNGDNVDELFKMVEEMTWKATKSCHIKLSGFDACFVVCTYM